MAPEVAAERVASTGAGTTLGDESLFRWATSARPFVQAASDKAIAQIARSGRRESAFPRGKSSQNLRLLSFDTMSHTALVA